VLEHLTNHPTWTLLKLRRDVTELHWEKRCQPGCMVSPAVSDFQLALASPPGHCAAFAAWEEQFFMAALPSAKDRGHSNG
jgi:hypothetical protein